ncbi:fatty acid hydroxylase [Polynucleobacter wuianus]|uniref:Fatty acid hydroxylase n=1 Tax=Polynucleobacter wuianus TaxID=1743168 RepID=A0A191UE53_9BURK|nr:MULTISPECIES: sterol desaturase family protein [Polynucleobacter]ANI99343.1 fatty acid hydroxylase [Polynucleobacter wuianus]MBU3552055.1 sterol desaturase family protein [Polynucleobacter sp. MWH-Post4-6-1]
MDFSLITTATSNAYGSAQEWIFSNVVGPLLYQLDLMSWAEDAFDGIDWFLFGCIQIFLIIVVLRTWERFNPAEKQERLAPATKADIFYTLFHRLGIFHGLIFIVLSGFFFEIDSVLHDFRFDRLNVENWWPGVTTIPWVSFLFYLVLLDFVDYLYHRASHAINWWWQLHALHHSQTVMTAWSDNRNHFLDDIMRAVVMAFFALLFGVSPGQFIALVALSQFIQSWQHANIKVHLGPVRYLLISPMYHRMHHAVGYGHEAIGKPGVLGGCNFGILFPWWDMALKTAIFPQAVYPTGVRNLSVSQNIITQQWQGLVHAFRELLPK